MTRILAKEICIRPRSAKARTPHFARLLAGLLLVIGPAASAATTNFFEGFETGLTNWVVGDANPDGVPAYWGRVDSAFGGEGTKAGSFKAYCAATGFVDTSALPAYRNDMFAYLSRTIDLTGYTNGTLTFWYKTPSIERPYDILRVVINQTELWASDQNQTSWRQVALSLEPFIGQTNTLTFQFQSDRTVTEEGCYLDSITLTDAFTPAPPPSHDNFSNAQTIVGAIGIATATTRGATAQAGEPDPGNSIWYRWTAYTNGVVTFRTGGSAIDTLLCVYTGSTLGGLNRIACDDNSDSNGNGASLITFTANAGTVYRISVRGASGAVGFVRLSWEQPSGVGPELLPDLTVWTNAHNRYLYGAYVDQNEQTQPGRILLRVSTATPNTGRGPLELRGTSTTPGVTQRIFRADGSWADRDAGIFTFHPGHGHLHFDNWLKLQLRAVLANDEVGEIVAAGQKTSFAIIDLRTFNTNMIGAPAQGQYKGGLIQGMSVGWADVYDAGLPDQWIDVTDVPSGQYWLEGIVDPENNIRESNETNNTGRVLIDYTRPPRLSDAPPNDNFANATQITGIAVSLLSHNTNATLQAGEPENPEDEGGRSVWWRWTAPGNIPVVITTDGSSVDTIMAVYRGTDLTNLVRIVYDDDAGAGSASRVSFQATAGTTYFVCVDGFEAEIGTIQLHVNPDWNDFFANSLALTDAAGSLLGRNVAATRQTGEPTHAGTNSSHSLWYSWTAPRSGPVTLDTIGSSFDTLLAVYRGSAINALTPVASDNNNGGDGASRLTFTAVSNTIYRIAVDGAGTNSGLFRLNWLGPSGPRITQSPASTNVVTGASAFFNVGAIGTAPMSFQWQHDGINLSNSPYVEGASTPSMRVVKALPSDAGIYTVVVSNAYGATTSAPVNLIILDNPRVVYISETPAPLGGVAVVPIHGQAVGNENVFAFTLQFDPSLLSNARLLKGDDLGTASVIVDNSQLAGGRLGARLSLPPGRTIAPGQERELARLLLDVSPSAIPGNLSPIGFVDSPIARFAANTNNVPLTTLFVAGSVEFQAVITQISVELLLDGSYRLTLQGLAGRDYAIDASSDLVSWELLTSAHAELDGSMQFLDPSSPKLPQRFYRARLVSGF